MIFGVGPVIRYEMITTARRARFYIVRVVYGLCLLAQLWILFSNWVESHQAGGSYDEIQAFAEDAFLQFAALQGIALIVLIPALVSGVVADEHQRKTLHYLLASRLSSAEIVLGKMGARLTHIAFFVALGVPIVSLLMLYGGLNPYNILYIYGGTLSVTVFVAGISILISILARRPREAMLFAYALVGLWLFVPIWISPYAHDLEWPLGWVEPVNAWLFKSNPVQLWVHASAYSSTNLRWAGRIFWMPRAANSFWGTGSEFLWEFGIMAGIQLGVGLLCLGLAVAGLRPVRGSSWPGSEPKTGWWTRLRGRLRAASEARAARAVVRNELLATRKSRPACGENPMFWKERYTRMGGSLRWLSSRPVALFFSVLLGCFLFDVGAPAFADVVRGNWSNRSWLAMNDALRASSVAVVLFGMLAVAAASATSLIGEREQDTWISLATTLLDPREIILAKQFGALWSAHWIGLALIIMWVAGILLGAIHPLGVLLALAITASSGWLIAAAGLCISSLAKNSTRALALSFVFLVALIALGQAPWSLWLSLLSYHDVSQIWNPVPTPGFIRYAARREDLLLLVATPIVECALAAFLTMLATFRLRSTWVAA
jgi:ABC-type transport system involved in multi-copper enzyme maturation permease subunit